MRVAMTVWQGRISPVCDVARQLLVLEVLDAKISARREERLPGAGYWQQVAQLEKLRPQVLICGAISS
ncbi:MAG: dinitrogenase iron-molybdenum cofactor biosynthesis domain-containing protein, partial [Lentisphaerae bacterium]|nr:dinitrogenase iron-molybdenum cofactor biosynthesis domain-containing protein [Lentisphaerota bacterium]